MNKHQPATNYAGYFRGEIRAVVLAPGTEADCWFRLAAKMARKVEQARSDKNFEVRRVSIIIIEGI